MRITSEIFLWRKDADLAYEEMICDACDTMLLDSNVTRTLAKLKNVDRSLWERIWYNIKRMLNKIRKLYKGLEPTSNEAKALLWT